MKEKGTMFISIGTFLYIILTSIDRFFVSIADFIFIPIAIVAIICIVIGLYNRRKGKYDRS